MFSFIKKGLAKTAEAVRQIIPGTQDVIERDTLEDILLESDVHYELIEIIIEKLPEHVTRERLRSVLLTLITDEHEVYTPKALDVTLIIGVNGAGKTTTIAKLAHRFKSEGQQVVLGAGDTFRAAAIEQLRRWAERVDVPIVYTQQGHDPSAVAFDAIKSAEAKRANRVLIDTAGRLQTQTNLANELKKIVRICEKAHEGAPHRKLLILDGTQGNSAISQAQAFNEMVGVDGIIITKLDGTAKGGALFSIAHDLKLPILYIGVGEGMEDLVPFDKSDFVDGFLDLFFTPAS